MRVLGIVYGFHNAVFRPVVRAASFLTNNRPSEPHFLVD